MYILETVPLSRGKIWIKWVWTLGKWRSRRSIWEEPARYFGFGYVQRKHLPMLFIQVDLADPKVA